MLFQQLLIGLAFLAVGGVSLKYNYQLVGLVRLQWLESKLGGGTSYIAYKVISVTLILLGIIVISGFGPAFANWIINPVRSLFSH